MPPAGKIPLITHCHLRLYPDLVGELQVDDLVDTASTDLNALRLFIEYHRVCGGSFLPKDVFQQYEAWLDSEESHLSEVPPSVIVTYFMEHLRKNKFSKKPCRVLLNMVPRRNNQTPPMMVFRYPGADGRVGVPIFYDGLLKHLMVNRIIPYLERAGVKGEQDVGRLIGALDTKELIAKAQVSGRYEHRLTIGVEVSTGNACFFVNEADALKFLDGGPTHKLASFGPIPPILA